MAQFNNRFTAAGTRDVTTLRRATNNAFTDLVRQMNSNLGDVPEVTAEAHIPVRPGRGQMMHVTSSFQHSGGITVQSGWYIYNGTGWDRLTHTSAGF